MEVKTISAVCSKKEAYKGRTIESDFEKCGKHHLRFFVSKKSIGVEISGFSQGMVYVFNPRTKKEMQWNAHFLTMYIETCDDSELLKIALGLI